MKSAMLLISMLCVLGCTPSEKDVFNFRVSTAEAASDDVIGKVKHDILMASTVKIVCNKSRSSGANTPYGILTCAHCVEGGHKIYVTCGKETTEATIKKVDAAVDLALLSVTWKQDHGELELSSRELKPGDTVFSSGRGVNGMVSVNSHVIANGLFPKEIRVNEPFNFGRSGSPVVDDRNAIVGIASKLDMTIEPYSGLASNALAIREFLPSAQPLPAESSSKRRVVIASATWCGPCVTFKAANKTGNESVEFVYIDIEKPMPPTVSQEEWDRAICTVNGMYGPGVERGLPLAVWRTPKGKWYVKTVGGMKTAEVQKWVN